MSKFYDEFFAQKGGKHDELVMKCVLDVGLNNILNVTNFSEYAEKVALGYKEVDRLVKDDGIQTSYETETICKNGNFIIGYADIIITAKSNIIIKRKYDGIIHDVGLNTVGMIVVEVKPELNDIGSALRQLKTYEQCIKHQVTYDKFYKAIATYSEVSEDVKEYLLHEGVHVIKF